MFDDPAEQFAMADLPGGEGEYHAGQFLLRVVQLNTVQGEKDQHGVCAGPLVAVYERVIFYKAEEIGRASCRERVFRAV